MFRGTLDAPDAAGIDRHVIADCGRDGALAHQAFVIGFRNVAFSGPKRMKEKLQAIALQCGGTLVPATIPRDAIDLFGSTDPERDAQNGLAAAGRPPTS